ncbi:MAG: Ig-like domain-containing protein [Chloroflexi bacterium]|nr:Ig-like domain-containing protein [Chloroflexota bacterium]
MIGRLMRALAPWFVLAGLTTLACDLTTLGLGAPSKPQVLIQAPASNSQFRDGEEIIVQSTATDASGITRVELAVDGASVETSAPPIVQGQASFTVIQRWKATTGSHTLTVRAYNASGAASDPALVTVNVIAAAPTSPIAPPTILAQPPLGSTPGLGVVPTLPPSETSTPLGATPTRTRTPTPRPTNTPAAPPGVYATSIRVDPASPKRGQAVGFIVTFLNTTGAPQSYQWRVRIFEPDKRNSFGDTAISKSDIPVGANELPSIVNWGVFGPTGCRTFIARVFWVDPTNKNETEFLKPDGSGGPATTFPLECP